MNEVQKYIPSAIALTRHSIGVLLVRGYLSVINEVR